MSQVIFEFNLGLEAIDIDDSEEPHKLMIELGNGVRLTTSAPSWLGNVTEIKLQIVLETDGSPPHAITGQTPEQ